MTQRAGISQRAALQRRCLLSEGGNGTGKRSKLIVGGSTLRPGPLGFLLAGPAVIFLMISLFCRKSLSPGETHHFRHGETRRWACLTLGPATSAATSQGTNTSFHPASFFAFFFPSIHTLISTPLSFPAPICPQGASLYFSVVIVCF